MRSRRRTFSAAMRLALRCLRLGRRCRGRLARRAAQLWGYGRLSLRSLLYNSFTDGDVVLDALFEPVYWLVDHVTRWFGVVSAVRRGGGGAAGPGPGPGASAGAAPAGVRGAGDRADELRGGHRLRLPAAPHPAHLRARLGLLAPQLRPLEPAHDRLPLLHGHHHRPGLPAAGRARGLGGPGGPASSADRPSLCRPRATSPASPSAASASPPSRRAPTTAASATGRDPCPTGPPPQHSAVAPLPSLLQWLLAPDPRQALTAVHSPRRCVLKMDHHCRILLQHRPGWPLSREPGSWERDGGLGCTERWG